MNMQLAIYFAVAIFACSQSIAATADDQVVQLEQSAYHVPVFKNDYVTVMNIDMPPGRGSDFHNHNRDQISVYLAEYPAEAMGQDLGGPIRHIRAPGAGPHLGEVSFNAYVKNPVINRGQNDNTADVHMYLIAALLNSPKTYGFTPQARNAAGYTQLLDNERVRVWRLVLQPGETAASITQQAPGMRVVVRGGNIAEISPGKRDRGMWLKLGDFFWQERGAVRSVKNIGTTPIEVVEAEFK
jgi:quercetin dioxygenase-like cupin family protein